MALFDCGIREQIIHGTVRDLHLYEPTLHIDNESKNRSGHMSHAMVELYPGNVLAFNSNCSAERYYGHSTFGWIEYRYSQDRGKTFGQPTVLPYSMDSLLNGLFTVSLEKAVICDDGTIVAFCLRNAGLTHPCWCEPWLTPCVILSTDHGLTWSEPKELCQYPGRVYDVKYKDGSIYALEFCNEMFLGTKPEDQYRIFRSDDCGRTFYEWSIVGFADTTGLGYGALTFTPDGRMVVYALHGYNEDEKYLVYVISEDGGKTWCETGNTHCMVGNPQIGILDGQYILHGRAGGRGFILYTSADGIHWDEGHMLESLSYGCFYSNNVLLHPIEPDQKNRLLVQFSQSWCDHGNKDSRVNVMHMMIESV